MVSSKKYCDREIASDRNLLNYPKTYYSINI